MTDLTHILGGPWSPPKPAPIEDQIRDAMRAAGVTPPSSIVIDGTLHRYQTGSKGQAGHDKAGWYVFFPDGVCAGMFGDWRTGVTQTFRAEVGRELTAQEQMAITRRQAEARAARDAKAAQAAETVEAIWAQAGAASDDHPYLARKRVKAHGLRITGDGRLMAPLYDHTGALSSLQYIDAEGGKLYHAGAATGGRYWVVGSCEGDVIYIAEGFATAATIHEVTGKPCVVAYSASNLVPVTGFIREAHPDAELVIVADNDASGVGQKYADQAAAKHRAKVVVIPIQGDANDYVAGGHDLQALLNPPIEQWLIPADEFSAQPAPLRWLVKGWIQAEALHMIHGPSGGGKTFAVLDLMLHMAAGRTEWNGCKVKPGAVVYLAGEGHHGLRGRVAAWKQHHQANSAQSISLTMWLSREGCDLNTKEGLQHVIDHIRGLNHQPDVIVVDTLHRFLKGDENSAQDAKTMLDACAHLMRGFGCAVILVHHTGVSEEAQHRARGSSAWRGALDIEISVVPGDNGLLRLVQRKSKDAELKPPMNGKLEAVTLAGWVDEDGEAVTSAVLVEAPPEPKEASGAIHHHQKLFSRAWVEGGKILLGEDPFVARDAVAILLQNDGYKPGSVKNMLAPSSKGKPVHDLLNAEWIKKASDEGDDSDGWIIIEPGWRASLLVISDSPVSHQ